MTPSPAPSEMRAVSALALLYMFRMMGLFMVFPVMTLYGMAYTHATPFYLGLAIGAYGLSQALCQIPMGLLSDLWGRKPIILMGLMIMIIGSLVAALADSVWGLILGRALQGIGAVGSVIMALVGDLTSEQNRTRAMGIIGASIGVSFILAMILGASVAAATGLKGLFWVTGGLSVVGIFILMVVVPNPSPQARGKDAIAVPKLLRSALSNGQLMRLNYGIFSLHFILSALFLALPLALLQAGHAREHHWQLYAPVLALAFIAMFPFMYLAEGKRKLKGVILSAIACLAVGVGLFSRAGESLASWWPGLLLFFTAFCLLEATLPSLMSKQAPAGSKGTAMGVFSTCQFLGITGGGWIGGAMLHEYGIMAVYGLCAGIAGVWLAIAFFMQKPVFLTSITVTLDHPLDTSALCQQVDGVKEAKWVEEQQLLHLKVEKLQFKPSQLEAYLAQGT